MGVSAMKILVMSSIVIISIFLLNACATPAKEIPAQYASEYQYKNYDCKQIEIEAERLTTRVNELGIQVEERASHDSTATAVGLILFWPALFFINGDGPEAQEYGRLKGEYETLKQISIRENCGFEFKEIVPPDPVQNKKADEFVNIALDNETQLA